jgi:hypothetical protein
MDEPAPTPAAADVFLPLAPPAELHPVAAAPHSVGPTAALADASEAALQTRAFDDFSSAQSVPPQSASKRCVAIKVINYSRRVKSFCKRLLI